jgi:putative flippase GtrA
VSASFAAYALVGALGALVHYVIIVVGVEALGWDALPASAAGFVAALVVQFAINRSVVFDARTALGASFLRYTAVSLLGLVMNLAILHATTRVLGVHYLAGALIAIAFVTPLNFALNRGWTFRSR